MVGKMDWVMRYVCMRCMGSLVMPCRLMTAHPAGIKLHKELSQLFGTMLLLLKALAQSIAYSAWPWAGHAALWMLAAGNVALGTVPKATSICAVFYPRLLCSRIHSVASAGARAGLAMAHDLVTLISLPLTLVNMAFLKLFCLHTSCLGATWRMMRGRYQPRRPPAAPGVPQDPAAASSREGTAHAKELWGAPQQVGPGHAWPPPRRSGRAAGGSDGCACDLAVPATRRGLCFAAL